MTNLTEAAPLRAKRRSATRRSRFVTDYDCWREATEAVSVEVDPRRSCSENADAARPRARGAPWRAWTRRAPADAATRMRYAIITDPKAISGSAQERLRPIAGRYL